MVTARQSEPVIGIGGPENHRFSLTSKYSTVFVRTPALVRPPMV